MKKLDKLEKLVKEKDSIIDKREILEKLDRLEKLVNEKNSIIDKREIFKKIDKLEKKFAFQRCGGCLSKMWQLCSKDVTVVF